MKVSVFDITVADWNTGNRVIMEAVYEQLYAIFPDRPIITLPYWEPLGEITLGHIADSDYTIYGGGNHLTSRRKDIFWGITPDNIDRVNDVILCGTGWWKHEEDIESETADALRSTLHGTMAHSVRDEYTRLRLSSIGITNVLVTGCPSMWGLTRDHCAGIPQGKSESVLFTFSGDFAKDRDRDHELLRLLQRNYRDLYFWPQGPKDCDYIKDFPFEGTVLDANLPALTTFLSRAEHLDYVGTRLHCGVKALQHRKRSMIIVIDERSSEMRKDFNLPACDIGSAEERILGKWPTEIEMPEESILAWQQQFAPGVSQ